MLTKSINGKFLKKSVGRLAGGRFLNFPSETEISVNGRGKENYRWGEQRANFQIRYWWDGQYVRSREHLWTKFEAAIGPKGRYQIKGKAIETEAENI